MKKILFITDSHGNKNAIISLKDVMKGVDYIFHAGDHYYDIEKFANEYVNKTISVFGNCDGKGEEKFFNVENVKILLVHGDKYHVKTGLLRLKLRALEIGANLVCFGHTHSALNEVSDGITYCNAGNLTRFGKKSYAIITVDGSDVQIDIKQLD